MARVHVIDGTPGAYQVQLRPVEQQAATTERARLTRRASGRDQPAPVDDAELLEAVISGVFRTLIAQQQKRRADRRQELYDGLSDADKATVDALLPTGG